MIDSPEYVCDTCLDTHLMVLGEREVPCTRCPTPCQKCRCGAFCTTTPCPCSCHSKVVSISTRPHKCTTRELDVHGRQVVHDRMVRVLNDTTAVGLRTAGDADFWELTPEQAEHLGIALIQVAAEVRIATGGGNG